MSFILKALKKLEDEKAARQGGDVDVPGALLRGAATPADTGPRLARWGIILLVFAAGSGFTYLLVSNGAPSVAPPREQAAPSAPPAVLPAAAPQAVAPPAATTTPPLPLDSPQATAAPERAAKKDIRRRASRSEPAAPADDARPLPSAGAAPPDVKVHGIAYQDDPTESSAVVNGALVKRGMTIGGMRVEEILPDRVRFSGTGGTVEVPLSR